MSDLHHALVAALASWPGGPLCVACSGGADSSALLHLLATLPAARARGLRTLHVDHGLHPDSFAWCEHARALALRLDVPFAAVRVAVDGRGLGLEAAARQARLHALRERLQAGELLLTAHHADDQAETVLLRLVRGAGARGLGAMRPLRRFGPGWLARPWLAVARATIREYASAHGLDAIDDPSNHDPHHDRGWLRRELLPRLHQRWPDATAAIVRSATRLRAAADAAETELARELAAARGADPATLVEARARAWSPALRGELLRQWYRELELAPPDARALAAIERELLHAAADASPRVRWPGAELRRHRGHWYALAPQPAAPAPWQAGWSGVDPLALPPGGTLALGSARPLPLRVGTRRGGERIVLAPNRPSQSVKHALQELGVPPWERARAPYLWHGDALWAVGDWLLAHELHALCSAHELHYRWLR